MSSWNGVLIRRDTKIPIHRSRNPAYNEVALPLEEFMINPALSVILVAATATTVVVFSVIMLTVKRIIDWFKEFAELIEKKQNLAFTYLPSMETDEITGHADRVVVVQGIFDTNSRECRKIRKIEAAVLDPRVDELHTGHSLVVWS